MDRRLILPLTALPLAAQGSEVWKTPHTATEQTAPPNIVLFLVDDMGWQDTSVPFHECRTPLNDRYRTPNMERLAEMGVRFTAAYACAISSPSRCSLLSGMNAARHRVTNWTLHYGRATDAASDVLELPDWHWNGIQPDTAASPHNTRNATPVTTLPQLLRDHGYCTIHCGKAHFGAKTTPGADPRTMGFEVNIAGGANGAPGSYLARKNFGQGTPQEVLGLEKYYGQDLFLTEVLTREAIGALQEPILRGQPFFLYMAHYAVHAPYEEDVRFTAHYRGRPDAQLGAPLNESETRYAALVEGMDRSLGDLLDFLEAHPETARNTIILFMSDNGGQGLNNVRQGVANRDQNWPARAGKGSAFLGGVREPMMVFWPGVTQGGTTCDQPVMIEDFFPTILEMAGVKRYETRQKTDGRSFAGVLRNPAKRYERPIVWHFPNLWGETQNQEEGYGAYSAWLEGDYHLIYTWETGRLRLYDIRRDIGEQHDLAEEHPKVVRRLAGRLAQRLREADAQRPSFRATGAPCPWPDELLRTTR